MRQVSKRAIAAAVLALALSACNTMQRDVDNQSAQVADQVGAYNRMATVQNATSNVRVVQRVSGAWLGGRAVPMTSDATLPEIFKRNDFQFQFKDGPGDLQLLAERLTKLTGIPVRVQPDALMPLSAFMDKSGGGGGSTSAAGGVSAPATATLPPLPSPAAGGSLAAGLSSASYGGRSDETKYNMNYVGTLQGFLELTCAKGGLSWDYHDGVITIRRFVTKVLSLKALPGSSGFDASLGREGQTQTGTQGGAQGGTSQNSGGYSSNTKIKMDSAYSVWTSVEGQIKAVKTPPGRYWISEATGTITVTDTKAAVDEISRIIDHENGLLTRQIVMRVEVLSVKLTSGQQYGIDWNVVFNKVTNMVPWALSFTSPTSLVSTTAGSLGASVLTPTSGSPSAWSGSKAMFNALQDYGRVKVVTTANAMTVNRQPVPVAITQQTGYLAEITPAPAGATGNVGGTPGLTPGTVTTGFMLNLLPTILDSNSILLQFSMGISSLDSLDKQTSGSGSNQNSIQTPTISSTDFLQKVALRPGDTLVLSGYEREQGQYDKRTLTDKAPVGLGGSFNGSTNREAVVILVTPVVAEGAI
ncbi:PilN family type IVB pilus formation outer membrane protein [Burkholderia vietnamiensis]|uniref:PilN family type IVB pilus formation outer membrane protein n=1 Tax=Burkholderia vietnamiensis TaxID=60552 RepID=UPI001BA1330B|nr:PilN family type IVB pilus formation outer membrane protein [Burkholderia vietnamiensis]MBR8085646.1 PilN family type IVB pilus formation outer membrane protein [Burkholderia vietnamiensis]